ncbi:hypothetical protein FSB08_40810, partial [Paraburkholderia sp. JPY432]|nr:hypothetical protein [Paraburkholderia youngii]
MTDAPDDVRECYRTTNLIELLKTAFTEGVRGRAMKRLLLNLTTATVLIASAGVSMAHTTPMPATPTTKILAIGTFPPGTDMQLVQDILPSEA